MPDAETIQTIRCPNCVRPRPTSAARRPSRTGGTDHQHRAYGLLNNLVAPLGKTTYAVVAEDTAAKR